MRHTHLGRYRQIVNTLARHGFGFLVDQLNLGQLVSKALARGPGKRKIRLSRGARLRLVFEELGPTFIKLGQVLSTRPDLIPKDMISELEKLQDRVPSFAFEEVKARVETELGQPLGAVFSSFSQVPLAAASIGQVHHAVLADGADVVVKVRRPEVDQIVRTDLGILFDLARLAQRHLPWTKLYNFVDMAEEFSRILKEELDYTAEGRNADIFRQNMSGNTRVLIPVVYWEYTTERVLTMEYMPGLKLSDYAGLAGQGWKLGDIARDLTQVVLRQVLLDGFFHADPHPGNVAVGPGGALVLYDFGMVGRLTEEERKQFVSLILGLVKRSSSRIIRALAEMGLITPEVDTKQLRRDVDKLRDRYYALPLSQIRLGAAVNDILELAFRHRIRLKMELALLAKVLLTLDGVVRDLDPSLSIVGIAEPLAFELMRRRLAPGKLKENLWEGAIDYSALLLDFPRKFDRLLTKMETGEVGLRLEHTNLDQQMSRLDRIANKLSFSLVLLGFSITTAGLLVASALGPARGYQLFGGFPVLEAAFLLAALMMGYLIWAIFRSGRF